MAKSSAAGYSNSCSTRVNLLTADFADLAASARNGWVPIAKPGLSCSGLPRRGACTLALFVSSLILFTTLQLVRSDEIDFCGEGSDADLPGSNRPGRTLRKSVIGQVALPRYWEQSAFRRADSLLPWIFPATRRIFQAKLPSYGRLPSLAVSCFAPVHPQKQAVRAAQKWFCSGGKSLH